jgi:NAD(P)-dependent dehydrogenase (short-subunit alcohol dehydrogenase family)
LAKEGYDIAGVDIIYQPQNKDSGLFEVKQRAAELGAELLPIRADISSLADHRKILNRVLKKFKKIDLLVNNAGIAPARRLDLLETTPPSFDRVMAVNARGTFFLTQAVARQMVSQVGRDPKSKPSIVFISSISATVSSPSRAEYCLSKAAVSQAAALFAHRLAECGINVYEIRPGIIRTDMTAPVRKKYDKLIREGLVPQGRWGFPQDVGKAVAALARGYFPYSTGMVIEVSGGMDIRRL